MTYQDIRGIQDFNDKTVIAIKAPPETKLEVPDPAEVATVFKYLILPKNHFRLPFLCL